MTQKKYSCYLDNCSTTAPDPRVLESMQPYQENFYANASSLTRLGRQSSLAVERSRKIVAQSLGAETDEIYFTSGGTESNNLAIQGYLKNFKGEIPHVISTVIEHASVRHQLRELANENEIELTLLSVNQQGLINPEELLKNLRPNTKLTSIIHGNNEVGSLQDLRPLGEICRAHQVLFHVDACQSFTRGKLNVRELNIDLISINGHKIHGPKGIGAIYKRKGVTLRPLFHGGGQEMGLRSGTYATELIVGLAKAIEVSGAQDLAQMTQLQKYFFDQLQKKIPSVRLNGPAIGSAQRLCHNLNIIFPGINGRDLLQWVSDHQLFLSTGSACSSGSLSPSPVLTALGLSAGEALSSVRFGLSKWTKREDLDYALEKLILAYKELVPKNDGFIYPHP